MNQISTSIRPEGIASSVPVQELATQPMLAIDGMPPAAAQRLFTFAGDVDRAMGFMLRWTLGPVLDLQPGERLDRWGITRALSERAARDAAFRREFLERPRYVSALAIEQGLGIKPVYFLWQVKTVHVLEEEPGLHWLVLPACHRGCAALDAPVAAFAGGSCQACGKPVGSAGASQRSKSSSSAAVDRVHDVDDFIVRAIQSDATARASLQADPTRFFARAVQQLFGTSPELAFGIREVRVAEDTDTLLYFMLLAAHEPVRSATRRLAP